MSQPARLAHFRRVPSGGTGPSSSCRLVPVAGGDPFLLTIGGSSATPQGRVFEIEGSDLTGTNDAFATVVEFDGPRSPEQVEAERFANAERIAPAAAQVPGTGGAVVLRGGDGAMVAIAFGESPEALEAASQTILSTPLLPGEDPALLPGPDRYTVCRAEGTSALTSLVAARSRS